MGLMDPKWTDQGTEHYQLFMRWKTKAQTRVYRLIMDGWMNDGSISVWLTGYKLLIWLHNDGWMDN
jgi:hypothetical protein